SLRTFGIPFRGKWVVNSGGGTSEHGYKAMKKLLASAPRPTAVFVDTDIKAVGALEAVRDAGLKVPDDISMMGFDDVPGMQEAQPPLTTIRAPHYELGCEAVRMLERRIKTRADVPGVALRTKLVVRASCGKA
ncbi:MAG: substrate-binding domain-containing protein, partial [Kiritimatiellae bacterium]|nr:substrate-binding domain-containing protein [Kiritimatiellia bacterium]